MTMTLGGAASAATGSPAVMVRGLRKEYGVGESRFEALAGVDLDVPAGQFLAVMGRSGSGKSTLLHLLAGLDDPSAGSIHIAGRELSELSDDERTLLRRKHLGLVFQAFNLVDVLTAEENVALPLLIDGTAEREAADRAAAALGRVDLVRRGHHLPKEMSGGEQQRVAIARALVIEPWILLADEPTGNLDSNNSDQIIRLLRSLVDDSGQTIVMVTHDPRHAEIADRVVEIRDGRIIDDRSGRGCLE